MAKAEFIPGLDLAGMLFRQVEPIVVSHWPELSWGATRWGRGSEVLGSEVLGYDSARSMDHDWGPRLQIYIVQADVALATAIRECLALELPLT